MYPHHASRLSPIRTGHSPTISSGPQNPPTFAAPDRALTATAGPVQGYGSYERVHSRYPPTSPPRPTSAPPGQRQETAAFADQIAEIDARLRGMQIAHSGAFMNQFDLLGTTNTQPSPCGPSRLLPPGNARPYTPTNRGTMGASQTGLSDSMTGIAPLPYRYNERERRWIRERDQRPPIPWRPPGLNTPGTVDHLIRKAPASTAIRTVSPQNPVMTALPMAPASPRPRPARPLDAPTALSLSMQSSGGPPGSVAMSRSTSSPDERNGRSTSRVFPHHVQTLQPPRASSLPERLLARINRPPRQRTNIAQLSPPGFKPVRSSGLAKVRSPSATSSNTSSTSSK